MITVLCVLFTTLGLVARHWGIRRAPFVRSQAWEHAYDLAATWGFAFAVVSAVCALLGLALR